VARQAKRKRRTAAEIEEIKAVAREELATAHPMTLRQVHYRIVARADNTYTNTKGDYNQLSRWLVQERLSGAIPWEWIEDRLRKPRRVSMFEDLEAFILATRDSYRRNVWPDQPDYLEVFVEKDALSAIFENVLNSYGVTLNVGRGYSSWSSIKAAADRFDAGGTILYFGDFDPSGEYMVRALKESLANPNLPNGGSFPDVIKCALTPADIQTYDLPPDFTKATDTRQAAFVERYGDVAVELDALPVGVLRDRIIREVERRLDLRALERTRVDESSDKERLDELLNQP
jgi:hypothetical protein